MQRKIIRFADHVVNAVTALFCVILLLYGGYALWDTAQMNRRAASDVYETYRPESDDTLSFEELRKKNPEVFGWLGIEGTHIDYPLVQGKDNSKYVNTDVNGEFSLSGSIFLDCRNEKDFSDLNNVIYGHHMEKEVMFGELDKFEEKTYFDKHAEGKLFYKEKWYPVEFFAFVHADAYDDVFYNTELNPEEWQDYLSYIRQNAQIFKELPFGEADRYVTLSTCTTSSTNGRYLLIGRIGKPEA